MLIKMSVFGGILVIFIVLIRTLSGKFIPKRNLVIFWDLALIRFIVPFDITMTLKITDLASGCFQMDNNKISDSTGMSLFHLIWALGVIIFTCIFVTLYCIEYSKLKENLPLPDDLKARIMKITIVPQRTTICYSERITAPITFGIVRPVIVLSKPTFLLDDEQLKYVLLHEIMHIKRLDNLRKIFIILSVCLHWLNPFVWIMYTLFNRDIEKSCDEKVINLLGLKHKRAYALTLLSLASVHQSNFIYSNGFKSGMMKERIISIMNYRKRSAISIMFVIMFLCISSTAFAQPKYNITIPSIAEIEKNGYPVNESGETYGSDIKNSNMQPDLQLVESEDGTVGYIRNEEIDANAPSSPEEAISYEPPSSVNIYTEDGKTVIGKFRRSSND